MAPLYEALRLCALMLALGLLASALASIYLAKRFATPVKLLSDGVARFGAGQLDQRFSMQGYDEFEPLAQNFNAMATEIESLTLGLESRIQEKTLKLETEHRAREESNRSLARLEERARVMRDLHDTVGGHLVTMLALVRVGVDLPQLSLVIQEALADLRLALDALSAQEQTLEGLLANLKFRLTPRLESLHIHAQWMFAEMPDEVQLSQEHLFHLQRILVEAITNVIKHAKDASTIIVRSEWLSGSQSLCLTVRDNGHAMAHEWNEAVSQGRGLVNMRRRASLMGGRLEIEHAGDGTVMKLTLSLAS